LGTWPLGSGSTAVRGMRNIVRGDARYAKHWFPIEQDVCYQFADGGHVPAVGVGRTIEISSREVSFTTQHLLERGENVRLAVAWPAILDNASRMKLEISGQVVRSVPGAAAIKIANYTFRTRGARSALIV
jgi:hypothetical protein